MFDFLKAYIKNSYLKKSVTIFLLIVEIAATLATLSISQLREFRYSK